MLNKVSKNTIICVSAFALLSVSACSKPAEPETAAVPETAVSATETATNAVATAPTPAPSAAPSAAPNAEDMALLASLPAPYKDGDLANGKRQFAMCMTCHSTATGAPNKVGPNLHGIVGKKAGLNPTFVYSEGLKSSGKTWDPATLDTYLTNPKAMFADSKMAYAGMPVANNRRDVIAYLKVETSK